MIWNFVLQHMKDVKKKIWRRRGPAVLVLCLAVIVQGCAGYPADKDGGHREQNKTNENGRLSVVTTIFPPYDFCKGDRRRLRRLKNAFKTRGGKSFL